MTSPPDVQNVPDVCVKHCRACMELKELTDFHRCKNSKDGRLNQCKACCRKRDLTPKRIEQKRLARGPRGLKDALRHRLERAVNTGKIKKLPCLICGSLKTVGHHADYSQPLSVTWICHEHHRQLHQEHKDRNV